MGNQPQKIEKPIEVGTRDIKTTEPTQLYNVKAGTCKFCGKKQNKIGEEGYWMMDTDAEVSERVWICHECRIEKNYHAIPLNCEWCNYEDVKWAQGGTYTCPRCDALNIHH